MIQETNVIKRIINAYLLIESVSESVENAIHWLWLQCGSVIGSIILHKLFTCIYDWNYIT